MRSVPALAALTLFAFAAPVVAQEPTQKPALPDSVQFAQMAGMFDQMGPMYESMMQAMFEGTLKMLERPETIDRLASFARRYYEALVRQGFTKAEALSIVTGAGIPGTKPTQ